MHSSIVLSALFAAVTFASPGARPDYVTEVAYVTEVTTVYIDAQPTQQADAPIKKQKMGTRKQGRRGHWRWSHNHAGGHVSLTVVAEPTKTEAPLAETPAVVVEVVDQYKPDEEVKPVTTVEEKPVEQPTSTTTPEPVVEQPTSTSTPEPVVEQPTSTPTPEPVAQQPQTQQAPAGSYKQKCLDHHNLHRANHSSPALEWDDELESIARQTAETCVYAHDTKTGGGGYGQNIAVGAPAADIGAIISDQFYNNEFKLYPGFGLEPDMSTFEEGGWGHLTQVLWKGTSKVACYTMDCTSQGVANAAGYGQHFTVCNYKSPGNVAGGFAKNVLPPKDEAYLTGRD